jgi:hypothetical protein
MALNQTDTTRRRLLKGIGATGLALGATGAATASGGDDGATQNSAESEDDADTKDGWEYRCLDGVSCNSGPGCQKEKRYCANGDCSGWEFDGCCSCL